MSVFNRAFDTSRDAAVVTGAGNGIGRAIALALAAEGVRTIFADINADKAQAAADAAGNPASAFAWAGDLAERAECDRLLADARRQIGLVNLFVHSASPTRHERDHLLAVSDATWARMRAVNLDAGFHLGREIAKSLIAAKAPGSMLYLTSLHAETPRNLPHYSSAKAAMAIMVKEFARALGRYAIRVNALVPGAIAAGGFVADPALARHIPLGRLGQAEDLAPMALAVLSDRIGGYVSGASIVVDGGMALTNWFDPPELG